jgi:hypothetical protein
MGFLPTCISVWRIIVHLVHLFHWHIPCHHESNLSTHKFSSSTQITSTFFTFMLLTFKHLSSHNLKLNLNSLFHLSELTVNSLKTSDTLGVTETPPINTYLSSSLGSILNLKSDFYNNTLTKPCSCRHHVTNIVAASNHHPKKTWYTMNKQCWPHSNIANMSHYRAQPL